MKFDNSFEVSLPPPEAWTVLMDVERIAPCMPGASLTEVVDDRSFKGTVSVRLGPVALTFEGEAQRHWKKKLRKIRRQTRPRKKARSLWPLPPRRRLQSHKRFLDSHCSLPHSAIG